MLVARDREVFGSYVNLSELEDDVAMVSVAQIKPMSARDAEFFDEAVVEIKAHEVTLPKTLYNGRLSARDLEFFEDEYNPIEEEEVAPKKGGCRDAEVFEEHEVAELPSSALPEMPPPVPSLGARDLEVFDAHPDVVTDVTPPARARRMSGRDDEF